MSSQPTQTAQEKLPGFENLPARVIHTIDLAALNEKYRLRMVPVAESIDFLRCLFYGRQGVGKTYLAASSGQVPEMAPILLLQTDKGTMSIASFPNVSVQTITNVAELRRIVTMVKDPTNPFKTVVVDDLLEFYNMLMVGRLKEEGMKPGHDPNVPQMQDWLNVTFLTRALLRAFKDLPVNLIVTTTAQFATDEQLQVINRLPAMPGKMAWEVGKWFDVVGYLTTGGSQQKITRTLQVQPYRNTEAKDRTGKLGANIAEPTMQIIYDAAFRGRPPVQAQVDEETIRANVDAALSTEPKESL